MSSCFPIRSRGFIQHGLHRGLRSIKLYASSASYSHLYSGCCSNIGPGVGDCAENDLADETSISPKCTMGSLISRTEAGVEGRISTSKSRDNRRWKWPPYLYSLRIRLILQNGLDCAGGQEKLVERFSEWLPAVTERCIDLELGR